LIFGEGLEERAEESGGASCERPGVNKRTADSDADGEKVGESGLNGGVPLPAKSRVVSEGAVTGTGREGSKIGESKGARNAEANEGPVIDVPCRRMRVCLCLCGGVGCVMWGGGLSGLSSVDSIWGR